jgi:hypothetical protein
VRLLCDDSPLADFSRLSAHFKMVGIELAADQAFAEAPDRAHHGVFGVERTHRISGERYSRRLAVDHALDDDPHAEPGDRKTLLHAVAQGAR